jgi:hypothetical protein
MVSLVIVMRILHFILEENLIQPLTSYFDRLRPASPETPEQNERDTEIVILEDCSRSLGKCNMNRLGNTHSDDHSCASGNLYEAKQKKFHGDNSSGLKDEFSQNVLSGDEFSSNQGNYLLLIFRPSHLLFWWQFR